MKQKLKERNNEVSDIKEQFVAEIGDGERHTIAIDAEWDSRFKPSLILGYALVVDAKYQFVVLNEAIKDNSIKDKKGEKLEIPKEIIERIENHCQANNFILRWMPLSDDSCDATSAILREYGVEEGKFDVLMYYAVKDLSVSFGYENLKPFYDKKILQRQGVSGSYQNEKLKYKIRDLYGWGQSRLKEFAASVGVTMTSKDAMDDYKSRMLDGLIDHPETFLDYMMGDTTCLFRIREEFVKKIQEVQRDYFKLPELVVDTVDSLPLTTGSIVASTLEKHLRHCLCPDRQYDYQYALLKLGIIKIDSSRHKEVNELHRSLLGNIKDSETVVQNLDDVTELISKYKSYQFEAFSQCSINYFGRDTKTTAAFLSLVQGGRCNNEQYWRYSLDDAADIDLKSAYATPLRKIDYPIGLPSIKSFTPNQKRWTLSECFKHTKVLQSQNKNWMVLVEGFLTFPQDLLYSKVTTQKKVNRAVIGKQNDSRDNDSDSHVPGAFILARKELRNTVITADIWETIQKVATSDELKELGQLEIVAAAYYRDEDKCADVDEWIDKVLADNGDYEADDHSGNVIDTRTRAWFAMPLENTFGGIIDKRNELKTLANKVKKYKGEEDEEYLNYQSEQTGYKLFVNTAYGVLASPYFSISNTVVANNITASIRLAVWQMNKALNTSQSITDGGLYEPDNVNKLKTHLTSFRKPSLKTLNTVSNADNRRNIQVVSLGDTNWKELISRMFQGQLTADDKNILKKHDSIALGHIKEFWSVYGLDFCFDVEHKTDNYAQKVAYWGKADYALYRVNGKRLYKIRGAKQKDGLKRHPKFDLMDKILAGDDTFPDDLRYFISNLMKLGTYRTVQKSSNSSKEDKKLQPGDEHVREIPTAKFNNTHIPVDTVKEYFTRNNRQQEKLFEKYAPEGIGGVHRVMLKDNLLFSVKPKSK